MPTIWALEPLPFPREVSETENRQRGSFRVGLAPSSIEQDYELYRFMLHSTAQLQQYRGIELSQSVQAKI